MSSSEGSLQDIVCCIGQPVAGNPAQFVMERAFAAAGMDWRFLTLEVSPQDLGDAVRGVRALGFRGASVTTPHKSAVVEYLDGRSDSVDIIQTVNCISQIDRRLVGENFEGKGLINALKELLDPRDTKITILGSGGMARAAAVEVCLLGVRDLTIVARTPERGEQLVQRLLERTKANCRCVSWQGDYRVDEETQMVVNATSIGTADEEARVPLDIASLRPQMIVADVTVDPAETRLLRDAARCGCKTLPGSRILVNQLALSFATWTGDDPDKTIMSEALEEYLEL